MKPSPSSNRNRRRVRALRNGSAPCPGGDCLCDEHEGKTDRQRSRAVAKRTSSAQIAADLPTGIPFYDEMWDVGWDDDDEDDGGLWTRFYTRRFDAPLTTPIRDRLLN